jgi:hypothetical protein
LAILRFSSRIARHRSRRARPRAAYAVERLKRIVQQCIEPSESLFASFLRH